MRVRFQLLRVGISRAHQCKQSCGSNSIAIREPNSRSRLATKRHRLSGGVEFDRDDILKLHRFWPERKMPNFDFYFVPTKACKEDLVDEKVRRRNGQKKHRRNPPILIEDCKSVEENCRCHECREEQRQGLGEKGVRGVRPSGGNSGLGLSGKPTRCEDNGGRSKNLYHAAVLDEEILE